LRIVLGIVLSLIIGTLLAVITENSKILSALLSPMLSVVKATPVASFIILALLWIKRDTLPLFITALIVVPIVWSNVAEGIRSVDKQLIDVSHVYSFSPLKKLSKLYVPSVAPFFMAACRSSLGMAWKAGISAEVLSTPENAIGTQLYYSKTYLETPDLFAWTLVVIVLSIIIEKLFVWGLEALGRRMRVLRKGEKDGQA
jgi:NitT/TauT family transport system permease protein